jgi:hypothetical protein
MQTCSERFELKMTADERRALADMKAATGRSEASVLRTLIRVGGPLLIEFRTPPPAARAARRFSDDDPPNEVA